MGNAIKFTMRGYVELNIKTFSFSSRVLKVQVKDTGVGISEQDIKRLCKAYSKLRTTQMMNKQGAGLGLAISQTLVRFIGPDERIMIKSQEGVGSKFSFLVYEDLAKESLKSIGESMRTIEKERMNEKEFMIITRRNVEQSLNSSCEEIPEEIRGNDSKGAVYRHSMMLTNQIRVTSVLKKSTL
jgi:hypothetical protein